MKFMVTKLVKHIRSHPMLWREKCNVGDDICESLGITIIWQSNNAVVCTAGDRHWVSGRQKRRINKAVQWARAYRVAYVIEHGKEERNGQQRLGY